MPAIPAGIAREDDAGVGCGGGGGGAPHRPLAAAAAGEAAPWSARAERRSEREARVCAARSDLIVANRF